jgi:hypothetical protein
MSCGGGHLGFPIGIKKTKFCRGPCNDHYWAVWVTKLPNTSSKGKAKFISQQTDKISQQPENWENHNGPDLVQAFPKKWWVESDFKVPVVTITAFLTILGQIRYNSSQCSTL